MRASALVAQRVANVFIRAAADALPPFEGVISASSARDRVLAQRSWVDLESLLELSWGLGIPILQLEHLPTGSKRFDGMAVWAQGRPAIVLASGRDGLAWLAFHLAHELGHVMLGHVGPGMEAWVDGSIAADAGSSSEEKAADEFACELLSGFGRPRIPDQKATAPRLAVIASQAGPRQGIDPGVYALIYAKSNNRWPAAQQAMKYMALAQGGRALVASFAARALMAAEIGEADKRLLGVLKAA